ncbi:DNA-binding protein [Pseudomonas sp. ABC1]|uniref:DNA-binding protein n=1 Tax=Pseudomonas sp. ABC1 TaxID=2748080 RepID=UPI00211A84D9|nr:DNA-binding protein [Pseudomonas sp. ABC1]
MLPPDGFDPQKLHGAPPMMPWQAFADWIGMGEEPIVVRTWVERGYLPSLKVGRRLMVNVALLTKELLERE